MKKHYLFVIVTFWVLGGILNAQVLLEENFDYTAGALLSASGWSAHSGTGTNSPAVVTPGLTYTDYLSSGIGNATLINNLGGEDVSREFTKQDVNGTSIYASLLVNVTDASASKTGDYFFHLGNRSAPATFTSFCARLFAKITAAGVVNFGISNANTAGTQVYSTTDYATNTTYLIIMKYTINQTGNDQVDMWVKSTGVPTNEASAGTADATQNTLTGQDTVNAVGLRQGSSSNSVAVIVDGIRISTTWSDLATVPVELTSFSANSVNGNVELLWKTATEKNNNGFEIERSLSLIPSQREGTINSPLGGKEGGFVKIGFVKGNGTTTNLSSYSFTDKNVNANSAYSYRLKQIDFDGTFTYSNIVNVSAGQSPNTFALGQNFPNPFNPSTVISYSLPQAGVVTLAIFNTLGQKVKEVVNGFQDAGNYTVSLNASDLSSGNYIYNVSVNGQSINKKMLLLK